MEKYKNRIVSKAELIDISNLIGNIILNKALAKLDLSAVRRWWLPGLIS